MPAQNLTKPNKRKPQNTTKKNKSLNATEIKGLGLYTPKKPV